MKRAAAVSMVMLLSLVLLAGAVSARARQKQPLALVKTIPLVNVEGRIDHFSVDLRRGRLFMSALGSNAVEVVDLEAGKRIHTIAGLNEPQGVLYVPETDKIFIANGESGACDIFDGSSFRPLGSVSFGDDADNLRYDRQARLVYVGYGAGALGTIDPAASRQTSEIKLRGHPESFQLESSGSRIRQCAGGGTRCGGGSRETAGRGVLDVAGRPQQFPHGA